MDLKKTKKQHFVSQFYLNNWAKDDGMISAKGEKSTFETSSINIGHMNNMYRIDGIGTHEKDLLLRRTEKIPEPMKGMLKSIIQACHEFRILSTKPMSASDASTLDLIKQNIIEKFYGLFEDLVQASYSILLDGKYDEFDLNYYQDILRFATLQLSRTSKAKETSKGLLESILSEKGIEFKDFDTLHSILIAEMITLTLIEKLYQIEILENKTDINFITSDNPVKNLLTTSDKHVELYWPISPRKAVLIKSTHFSPAEAASIKKNILNHGKNADYILRTKSVNDENKINELNKATWENKHRHAFYLADKDIVPLELRTP